MFRVGCCLTISCRPKVAKRRLGCVWGRALFYYWHSALILLVAFSLCLGWLLLGSAATGVLLLLRLLVRRLLLLLFPGTSTQRWDYHLYTAMAVCWDSANCHCFATSDPRKGRFAACGPKSMCVDAGLLPYLVLTSFWTSFFSFIRTHPAGKRACFAFLFVGVNSAKKGPLETGVPMGFDQKRIEHNRTMIVWSRLVKASVSNGERGFARSVPGQGSWRAF